MAEWLALLFKSWVQILPGISSSSEVDFHYYTVCDTETWFVMSIPCSLVADTVAELSLAIQIAVLKDGKMMAEEGNIAMMGKILSDYTVKWSRG